MGSFILIFACIILGWVLRRSGKLPASSSSTLNAIIICISLPATALVYLHGVSLNREILYPAGMAWILFAGAAALFLLLGKARRWSPQITGALILTAGLGNTSFVGFPLLETLYGRDSLGVGMLTDQPGSFLVLSSVGILLASVLSQKQISVKSISRRIFSFPPFIAMLLAFSLHSLSYPEWISQPLERLASTTIPLALLSVGMQIDFNRAALRARILPLILGLIYKLVLGPALVTLLYVGLLSARGLTIQITLAEAAMAPMVSAAIVSTDYGLDAELANLLVAIGIPLSLITVPLWAALLRAV